jgi:hypothetical protein
MKTIGKRRFKPEKLQEETFEKLFIIFLNSLPSIYLVKNKVIPFTLGYVTLGNFRITKKDAKHLLREFCKKGWLIPVKFRGFKINIQKALKILKNSEMGKFCKDFRIDKERIEKMLEVWKV